MAHKTLISGTAHTVKGGRDLIAGTGYAKKQGKTLINGTTFTLPFGRTVTVKTDATFSGSNLSKATPNLLITCNGTAYTIGPQTAEDQANKTFTAHTGDSVTLATSDNSSYNPNVTLQDGSIKHGPVTFTLTADTTIQIRAYSDTSGVGAVMQYTIYIKT